MMQMLVACAVLVAAATAFRCPPDSVLTWGTDKRAKQVERECLLEAEGNVCATKSDLDKAWHDFLNVFVKYEQAVKACRAKTTIRKRSTTTGDAEEMASSGCEGTTCSLNLNELSRPKRSVKAASKLRRHQPQDPMDPMFQEKQEIFDRTGIPHHRHRRHQNVRGQVETLEDKKESQDDNNSDLPFLIRTKRQTCLANGRNELDKLAKKYEKHCVRENICLPDEDLPPAEAAAFTKLHKERARLYAKYIGQVSLCYGKLTT